MNLKPLIAVCLMALLPLAGCTDRVPAQWGLRVEDRAKIVEAASKLEALAANLYGMAMKPVDYSAVPDMEGLNGIRFFAAEAARFQRAAKAWKSDGDVGAAYTNLTDRWSTLRNKTARLQSSAEIRTMLQRINEIMLDLGRLTGVPGTLIPPAAAPVGPAPTSTPAARPPAPAPAPPTAKPADPTPALR